MTRISITPAILMSALASPPFCVSADQINDIVKTWNETDTPIKQWISFTYMPSIQEVIFNGTHTVVKWNDGTITVVNCIVEDDFNYEVGLAMAISRKYFEKIGHSDTPRAAFLNTIKNAKIIESKEK